jgi:hypothetical protein
MRQAFLKAATAPAAVLFAVMAVAAMTTPGASAGEFCRSDVTGNMTSCPYASLAQCQAASAGIGGDCFRDPFLNDSKNGNANAYAYHPEQPRSKRAAGKADNTER